MQHPNIGAAYTRLQNENGFTVNGTEAVVIGGNCGVAGCDVTYLVIIRMRSQDSSSQMVSLLGVHRTSGSTGNRTCVPAVLAE